MDNIAVLSLLTKFRQALHQIPEKSCMEFKTSEYIEKALKSFKLKLSKIGTGIVCDIPGENNFITGIRCDMDALAITEKTDVEFASKNGFMHACGHDGHMAMVLVMAKILSEKKPKNSVRLIFQFGEESEGGAEVMVNEGAAKNLDEIFAFHLCPELEKGKIATSIGAIFAGAVEFDIEFQGLGAHCANREKGIDVFNAVNDFLNNQSSFNQRYKNNSLFHIGKITGGVARNVVADYAKLECSLRYFDENAREDIMMNIAKLLTSGDGKFGTSHKVLVREVYPPLINSAKAVARVKGVSECDECEPRYTAEDFAFFASVCPACMVWLGIKDEKYASGLHSDTFGFDEKALLLGVDILTKLVY